MTTKKKNSIVNSKLLEEFTLEYLKEHEELINFVKKETEKQLRIGGVRHWVEINRQEPPFDKKILTWNENNPDEPARTDTLIAIEHSSKGKLYKWLENGYPTHWMHLPKPPCA